jgi:hypothetical protein
MLTTLLLLTSIGEKGSPENPEKDLQGKEQTPASVTKKESRNRLEQPAKEKQDVKKEKKRYRGQKEESPSKIKPELNPARRTQNFFPGGEGSTTKGKRKRVQPRRTEEGQRGRR